MGTVSQTASWKEKTARISADSKKTTYEACPEDLDGQTCRGKGIA